MDGAILVVNVAPDNPLQYQVIARTAKETGARDVEVSPDGTLLYVTNFDKNTVTVYKFDITSGSATNEAVVPGDGFVVSMGYTLTLIDTIPVGENPEGLFFSPTTQTVVVANSESDAVSVIWFMPDTDGDGSGDSSDANGDNLPDERQQIIKALDTLLEDGDLKNNDRKQINKAIKRLETSLDPDLWIDANHLYEKHGHKVFSQDKGAVVDLEKVTGAIGTIAAVIEASLNVLVTSDQRLAETVLDEAIAACANSKCEKEIEKASQELAEAEADIENGNLDKAIDHFRKAWEHAVHALGKGAGKSDDGNNHPDADLGGESRWDEGVPDEYMLDENYPNPFNPETVIRYALPETVEVQLVVYDVLGRHIHTLVDASQQAGYHTVTFEAGDLPSGMYLYRLQAGTFVQVGQMVLLK